MQPPTPINTWWAATTAGISAAVVAVVAGTHEHIGNPAACVLGLATGLGASLLAWAVSRCPRKPPPPQGD